MSSSAATPNPILPGPSFVWSAEGKPVSVHLSLTLVRELESLLSRQPHQEPRPEEFGGLLLGRVREGAPDHWLVSVEDHEPIECEHVRGASWILSKQDLSRLRSKLHAFSRKRDGRVVVGWYRTHTRPGLFLDQHDFELSQKFFSAPSMIALAIRPAERGEEATAGFFLWEEADIQRASSYRTFPFSAARLAPAAGATLPEAPQPEPPPKVLPIRPKPAPTAVHKPRVPAVPALPPADSPAPPPQAAHASTVVKPAVRVPEAQSAAVRIRAVAAGIPAALRGAGRISETASRAARTAAEALPRKVAWKTVALWTPVVAGALVGLLWNPDPLRAPKPIRTVADRSAPSGPPSERAVFSSPDPIVVTPVPVAEPVIAPEQTRARKQEPAARKQLTSAAVRRPEARPQLTNDAPALPTTLAMRTEGLPALRLEPAPFLATATIEPAKVSGLRRAVGSIPGLGFLKKKKVREDFVPPRAIHQVRPTSPASLNENVPVRVKLMLDEAGAVVSAETLGRRVDPDLADLAVNAAKRWRFEPARSGDAPVPAEVVVQFRFGPG